MHSLSRIFEPPEEFNIADYFLDARVRDGMGGRVAIRTGERPFNYYDVQRLANQYGNLLREVGVRPEQRVIIGMPDGVHYAAALFGALKIGAVVVMVNPYLRADEIAYFYEYTRAVAALVTRETEPAFAEARRGARHLESVVVVDRADTAARVRALPDDLETFPSHRDDPAIWLFSGGTTGRPKAVVQTHRSYANTTECYAKRVLRMTADDVTISVPKLFFGYAMGSNLLFPFSVGASCVLFGERATPGALFDRIERFRPTVLISVPTMVQQMLSEPDAASRDLSSLRLATSAGEALPEELHARWRETFHVELLDGLGTAEMWHIFISNRPGEVRPGTLGTVVPGFDVRVRDDDGRDLPDGEIGWLWVRGDSRALGYWQHADKSAQAFRGEWYVSGDMIRRDADGFFHYCGRGDDMLKVSGKWLSPQEVENRLLQHPAVQEACVVGVVEEDGLTRPHAFVVPRDASYRDEEALCDFVRAQLASYKVPRSIRFMRDLPRTHLGKVDRGALRTA